MMYDNWQKCLHISDRTRHGYAVFNTEDTIITYDDGSSEFIPEGVWRVWHRLTIAHDTMTDEEFNEFYTLECNVPKTTTGAEMPDWVGYIAECNQRAGGPKQ